METSQDDTETPRGLIENFVEQATGKGSRKRRFFRTPIKERTIGGLEQTTKRRHASSSAALPVARKPKQTTRLSESSLTPRALVEQLTGDEEQETEDTLRVDARPSTKTRSRGRRSSASTSLNVSALNRSTRSSSLRKKVAVKQLLRGSNRDEATPRGLIEGFLDQGDQSATLIIEADKSGNKTALPEIDIPSKSKNVSLGESFFISSSAPEPRHLAGRRAKGAAIDKDKFVQQLESNVDKIENRTAVEEGTDEAIAAASSSRKESVLGISVASEDQGQASTSKGPTPTSSERKRQRKRSWIYTGPKKRRRKKTNSDTSFVSTSSVEESQHNESSQMMRDAHLTDGHISFTTNIQQMSVKDVTQDKTEELQRVLSSRRMSAVTPGVLSSVSLPDMEDTEKESPAASDRSSSMSPVIERSVRSSPRKAANESKHADSTANENIADRLSRRKSRGDNIAPLVSSTSKLRHSDVIDDGDDAVPGDEMDEQDGEGDKEVSSDEDLDENDGDEIEDNEEEIEDQGHEIEDETEGAAAAEEGNESDKDIRSENKAELEEEEEDADTQETQAVVDNEVAENSEKNETHHAMNNETSIREQNVNLPRVNKSRLSLRRSGGGEMTAQQEMSTRNESEMDEGVSTLGDATNVTVNNTTRLQGYDTLRTPQITTPAQPPRKGKGLSQSTSAPGTSQQENAAPKPAVKGKGKGVPKAKKETRPRLPKALTKSIFTHFASLGFTKDTLNAVEKVADKFWANMFGDLNAYAAHAHRVVIERSDLELLMTRQGFVTDKQSLNTLIEKWLPLEYRQELIPMARAGNKVEPKLK